MAIVEPQKAIAAFEKALALAPSDASLASKIGQVLVCTHEYTKAITYYSDAVASDATAAAAVAHHAISFSTVTRGNVVCLCALRMYQSN